MSVPDALAYLRALAGLAVVIGLVSDRHEVALGIFVLAALSDALDGWLARRSGIVTDHGAILDPLADKVLVLTTLAGLSLVGAVPVALAAMIAVRELLVSGLRMLRYRAGKHLPASPAAKVKTALEMCGLALLIVARPPATGSTIGVALLAAALVLGVVTVPAYFPRKRHRYTT
jgi:CDP-diacylglycerol--glycerol-3-phosphate 3-phosphatidyltransferase